MTIEAWQGDASTIDNTYGYNDMLILPGNGTFPVNIADRLRPEDATGAHNPSAGVLDADAEHLRQEGDRLFRLPNGGLLLRRSVFTEECSAVSRPNNAIAMSEDMARAVAFFGQWMHGSDPSGDQWCRRQVNGTSIATVETPWNLGSLYDLKGIDEILQMIRQARNGNIPSSMGQISDSDREQAMALARAVSSDELASLSSDIASRREMAEGLGDWFMRHPILHTLGIAFLFGLGTDVYHFMRFGAMGGQNPLAGGKGGIFSNIYRSVRSGEGVIEGIRRWWNQGRGGPGDPPAGGNVGGGGQGGEIAPAPEAASVVEGTQARVAMDPMQAQLLGIIGDGPLVAPPVVEGGLATWGSQGVTVGPNGTPVNPVIPITGFTAPVFTPVFRPVLRPVFVPIP